MLRPLIFSLLGVCALAPRVCCQVFSGSEALSLTAHAVAFGPRPDGSPAIGKLRAWIRQQLAGKGCEVTGDSFTAETPDGPLAMENIIARFPGSGAGKPARAIAVTGHFDTKKLAGFLGANDGGSSTGFLLELASVLQKFTHKDDIYLVFFDGEEAVREWSAKDSVYGSRHLAKKWAADGTTGRLKALINVDMIGDKNIRILWDNSSVAALRARFWDAAWSMGYREYFPREGGPIEDDHLPFIEQGVRAMDVINFESQNTFWHTPADTMDKLSPKAFQVVGDVVMKVLKELADQQ